MHSPSIPRGTSLEWADSLRTVAVPDPRTRKMDSFGYVASPRCTHMDRSVITSPFAGIDVSESFVTAAYQNHLRFRAPASDKLSRLQGLLDDPKFPNKASLACNSSVTSAVQQATTPRRTKNRSQLQDHEENNSDSPSSLQYTPSCMEHDKIFRKTSRPCSAPASRGTKHVPHTQTFSDPRADMFAADHDLAQSVWKTIGLNRRRSTEQTIERLFREWDVDGSNGISRQEFAKAIMKLRPITSASEIKSAFDEADLNKDGVIEKHEFTAWLDLKKLMRRTL